jgi:hypothetical protein
MTGLVKIRVVFDGGRICVWGEGEVKADRQMVYHKPVCKKGKHHTKILKNGRRLRAGSRYVYKYTYMYMFI